MRRAWRDFAARAANEVWRVPAGLVRDVSTRWRDPTVVVLLFSFLCEMWSQKLSPRPRARPVSERGDIWNAGCGGDERFARLMATHRKISVIGHCCGVGGTLESRRVRTHVGWPATIVGCQSLPPKYQTDGAVCALEVQIEASQRNWLAPCWQLIHHRDDCGRPRCSKRHQIPALQCRSR